MNEIVLKNFCMFYVMFGEFIMKSQHKSISPLLKTAYKFFLLQFGRQNINPLFNIQHETGVKLNQPNGYKNNSISSSNYLF